MSIYQGSRYEFSVVDFISIAEDSDANAVVFYEFEDIGTISYREHTYVFSSISTCCFSLSPNTISI